MHRLSPPRPLNGAIHAVVPDEGETKLTFVAGDTHDVLRNKTICPTARGLLLGLEAPDDGALIYSRCLLSDQPSAPGCVVLLVEDGGDGPVMWYCHPGDDQWVRHVYDIGTQTLRYPEGDQYEKKVICSIAACRGKFYFCDSFADLGVLEFCPDPVFSSIAIDDSYESEDDDEEEEHYEDNGPQPPKMDFAKRRWRDVDDLEGRMFLLSLFYFGASCAISAESSGLQQDCVYIVSPRRKEMQALNVKEDTIEVHKLDQAPAYNKAFWLLPSAKLVHTTQ
ncbi:hypothetical protein BS78_03G370900 [Paspalum vaginatum]|nr:hypothetical protein BS78_03G370900 [Paspalum vaginatum]